MTDTPVIVGRTWRNGRLDHLRVVTEDGQRVTVYPGSNVVAFPKSGEGARPEFCCSPFPCDVCRGKGGWEKAA